MAHAPHAHPPTAIPSGSRSSAPAHSLHTGAASRRVPQAGLDPPRAPMGWGRGRKPPTDRRGEGAPRLTVLVPGCPWTWSSSPNPLLCSALFLPRSRISGRSHRGRSVALDPRRNSLRAKAVRWRRGRVAWRAAGPAPTGRVACRSRSQSVARGPLSTPPHQNTQGEHPLSQGQTADWEGGSDP